jgi:hypothetical protein
MLDWERGRSLAQARQGFPCGRRAARASPAQGLRRRHRVPDGMHEYVTTPVKRVLRLAGARSSTSRRSTAATASKSAAAKTRWPKARASPLLFDGGDAKLLLVGEAPVHLQRHLAMRSVDEVHARDLGVRDPNRRPPRFVVLRPLFACRRKHLLDRKLGPAELNVGVHRRRGLLELRPGRQRADATSRGEGEHERRKEAGHAGDATHSAPGGPLFGRDAVSVTDSSRCRSRRGGYTPTFPPTCSRG